MATMKILFLGAESVQGRKKDTRVPYGPFYIMRHAVPVETVATELRQVEGIGYKVMEVNVSREVFEQFRPVKPLSVCEIDLQPDPSNFTRTIVAGVLKTSAAA